MDKPRFFISCCRHMVEVPMFGALSAPHSCYSHSREVSTLMTTQPTCGVNHPQKSPGFNPAAESQASDVLWDEPWP